MVSGSVKCIKYLLFVFNFLFFLTGCTVIGLGVWLNVEKNDWQAITDYSYISIANAFIVTGVVIVIISFLGCCGAITENKCMLLVFFIFLLVVFLMELVCGILAYVWRGKVVDEIHKELKLRIPERYYKEVDLRTSMNLIQRQFKCCGIDGFTDWKTKAPDDNGEQVSKVDKTCCIQEGHANYSALCTTHDYTSAEMKNVRPRYYEKGCLESIKDFIREYTLYLGLIGIVFAIFQIIGLAFSMTLYCRLRSDGQIV